MDRLRIRKHPTEGHREIYCFLHQIKTDVEKTSGIEFPMTKLKVESFRGIAQKSRNMSRSLGTTYDPDSSHIIEELTHIWENDARFDKRYYKDVVAFVANPSVGVKWRFAYVSVKVVLELHESIQDYKAGLEVYTRWESLINQQMAKMSRVMQHGFQATESAWHWFRVLGVAYSLCPIYIAVGASITVFVVAICFFRHPLVGVVTALAITSSTISTLGVECMMDQRFDVIDVINSCLVVALSQDYILHMAVAYTLYLSKNVESRMQRTLATSGVSVISGASTVIAASFPLTFSRVRIISTFGVQLAVGSAVCLLHSVVIFPVVVMLFARSIESSMDAHKKETKQKVTQDDSPPTRSDKQTIETNNTVPTEILNANRLTDDFKKMSKQKTALSRIRKFVRPRNKISSLNQQDATRVRPTNEEASIAEVGSTSFCTTEEIKCSNTAPTNGKFNNGSDEKTVSYQSRQPDKEDHSETADFVEILQIPERLETIFEPSESDSFKKQDHIHSLSFPTPVQSKSDKSSTMSGLDSLVSQENNQEHDVAAVNSRSHERVDSECHDRNTGD